MKKETFQTGMTKEEADKIVGMLEKYAFFEQSSKADAQRYLKRKQLREERQVLVDGVYRDRDDLDGKKAAAAARREERKKWVLICLGILLVVGAFALCVLTAKGINPLDGLTVRPLSQYHFRF